MAVDDDGRNTRIGGGSFMANADLSGVIKLVIEKDANGDWTTHTKGGIPVSGVRHLVVPVEPENASGVSILADPQGSSFRIEADAKPGDGVRVERSEGGIRLLAVCPTCGSEGSHAH